MSWCKELVDISRDKVGDVGDYGDGGVEECDLAAGGFSLGQGLEGVRLVEQDLTLEIGRLNEVAVDEGKGSDAGAGEERCCCGSSCSATDDGDVGGGEELLS